MFDADHVFFRGGGEGYTAVVRCVVVRVQNTIVSSGGMEGAIVTMLLVNLHLEGMGGSFSIAHLGLIVGSENIVEAIVERVRAKLGFGRSLTC